MDSQARPYIAAALTTYNRRATTLSCLAALRDSADEGGFVLRAFVADASSRDGTAEAVRREFDFAQVAQVEDDVFWNQGMIHSMGWALDSNPDMLLMLNDDTILDTDALRKLWTSGEEAQWDSQLVVVVGEARDPNSGTKTYGLLRRVSRRGLRFEMYDRGIDDKTPDTFNGNIVLMPAEAVRKMNGLDARFSHAYGDIDLGLRCKRQGVAIVSPTSTVGRCAPNSVSGSWMDVEIGLVRRLRLSLGAKGVPFREHLYFAKKHGGVWWPYFAVRPYSGIVISSGRFSMRRLLRWLKWR